MGGADVIPGVSGGTIAFISGIYTELISSLNEIDLAALRLLGRGQVKELWKKVNGSFLVVLFAGILTSLFSFSRLMTYLLVHDPIQIWSFFFGLILISAIVVLRGIMIRRRENILMFLVGTAIAYAITVLSPAQTPNDLWFIFIAGAIAICAMILPGISGAFMLLLLGKYEHMLNALVNRQMASLIVFALGCVCGLVAFSRALKWLLSKHHDMTIALLAGFMLGSLNKVWPWKTVISYRLNENGEQVPLIDRSVLPFDYLRLTGKDPLIFQALLLMAAGVLLIVGIERIAAAFKN
jgi:putative membrane protein